MGKKEKWSWSWSSAFIGAATATATAAVILGIPKDPSFHLVSIKPTSFKLNNLPNPHLDTDLILTVHVTNPNIVPIKYSSSSLSIFYHGSLLGSAQILPGFQQPKSCQLLKLSARLDQLHLKRHASRLISDVAKRKMLLDAAVEIGGTAKILWWDHRFKIHVDSHFTVDPVFLDVIEQENKPLLELFPGSKKSKQQQQQQKQKKEMMNSVVTSSVYSV